jgi:hypothetical protein
MTNSTVQYLTKFLHFLQQQQPTFDVQTCTDATWLKLYAESNRATIQVYRDSVVVKKEIKEEPVPPEPQTLDIYYRSPCIDMSTHPVVPFFHPEFWTGMLVYSSLPPLANVSEKLVSRLYYHPRTQCFFTFGGLFHRPHLEGILEETEEGSVQFSADVDPETVKWMQESNVVVGLQKPVKVSTKVVVPLVITNRRKRRR